MRVLVRKQVGSTVGGIGAAGAAIALESPELIPVVVPIGSAVGGAAEAGARELGSRAYPYVEEAGRRVQGAVGSVYNRVMGDPVNLSEVPILRDAFIRLEGAVRAAHACDYEQMIFDFQLAENLYTTAKDRFMAEAAKSPPAGGYDAYAKEIQRYIDETFEIRRNRVPQILKEECGCRR